MPRIGVLRDVSALPDVRRVTLGWGPSVAGEFVARVTMLVYTYQAGGAGLVAVYGVASTLPAAVATPLATGLVGRIRRDRMLLWTTASRTALLAAAALSVALVFPLAVFIVSTAGGATLAGIYRPLQADMMPWLVRTPTELGSANVAATMRENAAALAAAPAGRVPVRRSGSRCVAQHGRGRVP